MTDHITVCPENLTFYEMGVRLQQAITLHDYALGWCSDGDSSFGKMFTSSIERLRGASHLLPLERGSRDATRDLITEVYFSWENLRNSRTRRYLKRKNKSVINKSFIDVDESFIKPELESLKEHLLLCTDYMKKLPQCRWWFRIGMAVVDGTGDVEDWRWNNSGEFDQLSKACGVQNIDVLFPSIGHNYDSDPYGLEFSYPPDRSGWHRAETGLSILKQYQLDIPPAEASGMDANEILNKKYHDQPPPPEWGYSVPVEGTLKDIAEVMGMRVETLKKKGADGSNWIEKVHGRLFRVYYKAHAQYETYNRRLCDFRNMMKHDETR